MQWENFKQKMMEEKKIIMKLPDIQKEFVFSLQHEAYNMRENGYIPDAEMFTDLRGYPGKCIKKLLQTFWG